MIAGKLDSSMISYVFVRPTSVRVSIILPVTSVYLFNGSVTYINTVPVLETLSPINILAVSVTEPSSVSDFIFAITAST